jgi:hypothetical protein
MILMILMADSAQMRLDGRQKLLEFGPKRLRLSVLSLGRSGDLGSLHGLAPGARRRFWVRLG